MRIGTSQCDITPAPGVELSGFAARIQPSTGILDRLFAKALYLHYHGQQLLWLHCDLVGYDRALVEAFREWAKAELGLSSDQVILSATHTHSGPATIHLQEAGAYDAEYVRRLQNDLRAVSMAAISATEPVGFVRVESQLELAVDRRKGSAAKPDPRIGAFGFKRADNTFAAAIINYPIHPVALGSENRLISGDLSGRAALALAERLPGHPMVFMTNGASGNLNPPAENVAPGQVQAWGGRIADAVANLLKTGGVIGDVSLSSRSRIVRLPLDVLSPEQINESADRARTNKDSLSQWAEKYLRVIEHWRRTLLAAHEQGTVETHREAELFGIVLHDTTLLGVNAEVFSEFTDWLRRDTGRRLYILAYANGDTGYLPTSSAYEEGGYEVEVAHLFYGGFRPQQGSLETLAEEAKKLVLEMGVSDGAGYAPSRVSRSSLQRS